MNPRAASAVSELLPEFPWDTLADATALAKSHPGGIVDLSVGTPVDPVAPLIREALAKTQGNQTRAAELLGLSRFGLQKMMKRLNVRSR